MARWKREFRAWVKAQGLQVYALPRHPKSWDQAKLMSQLLDSQARSGEFDDLVSHAMIYGAGSVLLKSTPAQDGVER